MATTVTLTQAQFEALSTAFNTLAEAFSNGKATTNGSSARKTRAAVVEEAEEAIAEAEEVLEDAAEADDDEEDSPEALAAQDILESDRGKALMALPLGKLKKMAIDLGYEEEGVNGSDKMTLAIAIVQGENEVEGEADDDTEEVSEDDDTEEAVAEEQELKYEDLDAMGIRALRKFVTDTWDADDIEIDVAKASKADIMDWVFPGGDDDEAEADDDDEADDDEVGGLTVDELNAMSIADLRETVKNYGGTPKPGAKKPQLIKQIEDLADVQY